MLSVVCRYLLTCFEREAPSPVSRISCHAQCLQSIFPPICIPSEIADSARYCFLLENVILFTCQQSSISTDEKINHLRSRMSSFGCGSTC